jgi:hypothetical protein
MRPRHILAAVLAASAVLGTAHTAPAAARRHTVDPDGQAFFDRIKGLEGEWGAKSRDGEMINRFRPFAFGTAVLHEEWINGEPLTATVFYMVGAELHADHFCDFKNQLRYVVTPTDPSSVTFELRDAHNLDVYPRHFHSSTWHFRDATHLGQEWEIVEPGKAARVVKLEFVKKG